MLYILYKYRDRYNILHINIKRDVNSGGYKTTTRSTINTIFVWKIYKKDKLNNIAKILKMKNFEQIIKY